MQRARAGVLWLRGTRGILPNVRLIVQKGRKKAQEKKSRKKAQKAQEEPEQ